MENASANLDTVVATTGNGPSVLRAARRLELQDIDTDRLLLACTLPSFHAKKLTQEIIRNASTNTVQNQLRVLRHQ